MNNSLKYSLLIFLAFSVTTDLYPQLLIAAKEPGKKYGYIDERGIYKIEPQYQEAFSFHEGYAIVKTKGKFGVINSKNEFVVKPVYDNAIGDVNQRKVTLYKGKLGGVIDVVTGKTIIPHKYEILSIFNDGYVIALNKCFEVKGESDICEFSVYDESGREMLHSGDNYMLKFDDMHTYNRVRKGLLVVNGLGIFIPNKENEFSYNRRLLLDVEKKSIVEFGTPYNPNPLASFVGDEISESSIPHSGLISIKLAQDTIAYYDQNFNGDDYLKIKFKTNASVGYPFFNGVAVVVRNGLLSFIDDKGTTLRDTNLNADEFGALPPMYFNGLVGLWNKKGKAGFVDLHGQIKMPFQFEEYHPFEYDVTPVKLNGKYGLIKKDGSWAVEPKFEELSVGDCPCYR